MGAGSGAYVWIKTRHYPYRARSGSYGYDALIGVGGNLGDTVGRLERLFGYWQRTRQLRIVQTSPILRNPPFGYVDQPDFYNALIHVRSALDPHALLRYLLYTEKRFGRVRSFANAPRTLDLDLIFYDARTIRSARLQVPHPFWCTRRSVVWPLTHLEGGTWLS